jgi:hypothetical protein
LPVITRLSAHISFNSTGHAIAISMMDPRLSTSLIATAIPPPLKLTVLPSPDWQTSCCRSTL